MKMEGLEIRKIVTIIEETGREASRELVTPIKKGSSCSCFY